MQPTIRRTLAALSMPTLLMLGVAASACSKKEEKAPLADTSTSAASDELEQGDPAPSVTLKLHDGSSVELASLKGSKVLLYFYPKDDTPGCTVEAQGLRDHHQELTEAGVKIYGISTQDAASHQAFIDKYQLPFPLVVDDGNIAEAFGVPLKSGMAARHSFLIGKDGKIVNVWRSVSPEGHAEEVLRAAGSDS